MAPVTPRGPSADAGGPPQIDWECVVAEHQRWLRTVVLARLGEPQAVDEVFQEVVAAAVGARRPLQDRAKLVPWLYRLAVRQSLLYRRRAGRRRKLVDRYAERFPPAEADGRASDPLAWLLADERRKLVRQALGQLPRRDAEILLLKYTEDWSYGQLAERLGISRSALEARLHRARSRLRTQLARLEVVEVAR